MNAPLQATEKLDVAILGGAALQRCMTGLFSANGFSR
jgi:hypothetical protein